MFNLHGDRLLRGDLFVARGTDHHTVFAADACLWHVIRLEGLK